MIDDPKKILEPETFLSMCRYSPQQKTLAIKTAQSARCAYGVQNILEYLNKIEALGRQLTPDEQEMIADMSWYCNHEAPHDEILNYVRSIPDDLIEEHNNDRVYNC